MYIDMYISAQQISYRFYVLEKLGVRKNDFFLNSLEIDFEKKKTKRFPFKLKPDQIETELFYNFC